MKNINNFLIDSEKQLKNVLDKINVNGKGICIVTSRDNVVGIITDGDIRRFIIKNSDLSIKAS